MLAIATLVLACSAPDTTPEVTPRAPDAGSRDPKELPAPTSIGGGRPAGVIVPIDYDGLEPRPAIFLLGGYDNLSKDLDEWVGVSALVNELGFVLVMPDGRIDKQGSPFWNATDTCCDDDGTGIDDLEYLVSLRNELKLRVAIDASRIAVFGHSAGGFMAYRLACDAADQFTAIASLAGSMWLDLARCRPTKAVSILQVHGTSDDVTPVGGDDEAPGPDAVIARWIKLDRCTGTLAATSNERRDDLQALPQEETTLSPVAGCPAGAGVEPWRIEGADRHPQVAPAFTADVVRWLLAHPRP
jgi:polyhydroxybutyrate depolymerase